MSFIPNCNTDYSNVDYWNKRFETEENYEWCKKYEDFRDLMNQYVPRDHKILIVGNGNSYLPLDLYNDGYTKITSLDFAQSSIDKLKEKSPPDINYVCSDMRYMKFDDNNRFDTIIEKGTIDVLFTKETSPWNVSDATLNDVNSTLNCIKNCMNTNSGQFISITFGEPFFRKKYYCKYWDDILCEKFGDLFHYYFIVCKSK